MSRPAIPALESALGSHPCGALSSAPVLSSIKQTFWPESVKSQGGGDGVPEFNNALVLSLSGHRWLASCMVDCRRRPIAETLVQALVVVEPEVTGDTRSRFRH